MQTIMSKSFRSMFLWYMNDISTEINIKTEKNNKRDIDTLIELFYNLTVFLISDGF